MIAPADISVIVQGPVVTDAAAAATTREVLASVRKFLPGAEIIFSTWENQDISALDYDLLVTNPDPGSVGERANSSSANIYRQIVSSRAGLQAGTRPYGLKLRSDTSLLSAKFLELWDQHSAKGLAPRYFSKRALVSAVFSPCPRLCPSPYWVSDFFAFGLLEDVKNLWDIPLDVIDRLFERSPLKADSSVGTTPPLNAEQRLILAFAEKNGHHDSVRTITSVNPVSLARSEKFIASHFLPVAPVAAGFNLPIRFSRFESHQTYRVDHEGGLFRSPASAGAYASWLGGLPAIGLACAKGVGGRLIRRIRNAARKQPHSKPQ